MTTSTKSSEEVENVKNFLLEEGEHVKDYLRDILPRGSRVWTILRHRARGGMSREISVVTVYGDHIINLDSDVGLVLGLREGKHGGLVVRGTGEDIGLHLINALGGILYRDEYTLKHSWI